MSPGPRAIGRLQVVATALLFSTGGAAIKATTLNSWQVAGFRSAVAAGEYAPLDGEVPRGDRRDLVVRISALCPIISSGSRRNCEAFRSAFAAMPMGWRIPCRPGGLFVGGAGASRFVDLRRARDCKGARDPHCGHALNWT